MNEGVSHEEIYDRLERGGDRMTSIESKLSEVVNLLKPLPDMQRDIAATKDIVEAWSTAKNIAHFLKWSSGIVAALGILWVAVKAAAKGWLG